MLKREDEKPMKVCLFGSYAPDPMNEILKKKLELAGIEIVECQEDIHKSIISIVRAYVKLFFKLRRIDYDIIIIPLWRALLTLPLAKIFSRKPIVYYGYMPVYDTVVNDRKLVKPNSLKAKLIYLYEKLSWRFSDMIIKESDAEIDYCVDQFHADRKKFRRLFISADESKFLACPFKEAQDVFTVFLFGTFIPHHGIETVIEAAKILSDKDDIIFKLAGKGQSRIEMEKLAEKYKLKNVEFLGWVEFEVLLENINESDVCLGIFGGTSKASYGVTNKVYQILCSQKPLITMDSKAIHEIHLENGKSCILVPSKDPQKLAEGIIYLKNNAERRREIALTGRKIFLEHLSMEKTSRQLVGYLYELLESHKRH